jgi:6-phosphogluconolactonase (cycloisomerase 2 family)
VPDQGSSRVWRLGYSPSQGLKLLGPIDHFEEADGPRHVALHPNGGSSPGQRLPLIH